MQGLSEWEVNQWEKLILRCIDRSISLLASFLYIPALASSCCGQVSGPEPNLSLQSGPRSASFLGRNKRRFVFSRWEWVKGSRMRCHIVLHYRRSGDDRALFTQGLSMPFSSSSSSSSCGQQAMSRLIRPEPGGTRGSEKKRGSFIDFIDF